MKKKKASDNFSNSLGTMAPWHVEKTAIVSSKPYHLPNRFLERLLSANATISGWNSADKDPKGKSSQPQD